MSPEWRQTIKLRLAQLQYKCRRSRPRAHRRQSYSTNNFLKKRSCRLKKPVVEKKKRTIFRIDNNIKGGVACVKEEACMIKRLRFQIRAKRTRRLFYLWHGHQAAAKSLCGTGISYSVARFLYSSLRQKGNYSKCNMRREKAHFEIATITCRTLNAARQDFFLFL
jgi:hypothetical protein